MEDFENKDNETTEETSGPDTVSPGEPDPAARREEYPGTYTETDNAFNKESVLNKDGGVFGEKSFAPGGQGGYPGGGSPLPQMNEPNFRGSVESRGETYRGYQPYNYYSPGGYSQSGYGQSGYNPGGYNPGGYAPQNGYARSGGAYGQGSTYGGYSPEPQREPIIPEVSPSEERTVKKTSAGWIAAMIIALVLAVSAVMVLLALRNRGNAENGGIQTENSYPMFERADDKENASPVNVVINVQPKPVEGDEYYQNKETGLLTPEGAAKTVLPSVVNIYGYTTTTITPYNMASGVLISEDGYIITNAHAVEELTAAKAIFSDGSEYETKIVGYDTETDLAVLKIEAENVTPAVLGSAKDLSPGEQVMAIGNAGGFSDTVTTGCVSYVGREIESYTGGKVECVQTDAVLNFGNSGGALVNMYGQVVGIVTSKYSFDGDERVGFAIMTDFAIPIVEDIIEKGYVTGRPRVGVTYQLITPDMANELQVKPGMLVDSISDDCDISQTRLKKDDIITELDGVQILSTADVNDFRDSHKPGDKVTANVYRKSITGDVEEFEITFTLEESTGE